ncbi:MAG: holo-ACP synthase [Gemmatimonadales bacterium]
MAVIGIGVDVVDVARAQAMLTPHRRRVLERLLTADERAYVSKMRHPARHLAVRLAAKEAVYKAFQTLPEARAIGWRDIEVRRSADGRPMVELTGLAAALFAGLTEARIHLSLSHSDLSGVAMAVLETGSPGAVPGAS